MKRTHELLTEAVSLLDAAFAPLPKIAHAEAKPELNEGVGSGVLSQRDKVKDRSLRAKSWCGREDSNLHAVSSVTTSR